MSENAVNASPEDDWEGTASAAAEEAGSFEVDPFEKDPKSLTDLKSLRKLIDQKNKSIVRLLNRRAGYALRIAEVKRAEGLAIRDEAREQEVLKKVSRYNKGPLSDEALHRIFDCIMEEHRRLEEEHKGDALPENKGDALSENKPGGESGGTFDAGVDHER